MYVYRRMTITHDAQYKKCIVFQDVLIRFGRGAMLETRSAVYKMMKEKAHDERQVK